MELLAPAGNLESGIAAFTYGADAVYLGMQDFSARADADNFTLDDLATLIGVAHQDTAHPRKVYVAVNTLVREQELPRLITCLGQLQDMGTDALIIQDWAVHQLVREHFPSFQLHASTQLAIHNVPGAVRAHELGFSRIVCARELTLPEIERMSSIPGLETEIFIHGALCYSYSGLCLLSAALRGTSGNRGTCEYICRASYAVKNGDKPSVNANIMSMKDLATGDLVAAFHKAGVTSLKIEGRKKTPLYVSAVTHYYRRLLDGTFKPGEQARAEADIRTIFSRPWTPFHYKRRKELGITDIHTVGHRGTDAGIVLDVIKGVPDRLRFTVKNQPLEKHDGLQIELQDRDRPFGFPVNDIRLFPQRNNDTWKNAFEAPVDATVEVSLPEEHPDIPLGSRIFCSSSQAVKRSYSWEMPRPALVRNRFPMAFEVSIHPETLSVTSRASTAARTLPATITEQHLDSPLSPARQPEKVQEAIKSSFSKLGDTVFRLDSISISNPDHLHVPVSVLNDLRRSAAEDTARALDDSLRQQIQTVQDAVMNWKPEPSGASSRPQWVIAVDRPYFLNLFKRDDLNDVSDIVFSIARTPDTDLLPALAELEHLIGEKKRIRIALPAVCRTETGCVTPEGIATLVSAGYRRWEAANIGSLQLLKDAGAAVESLDITAGWSLFTTNRMAAKSLLSQGYHRLSLSPDDTWENWQDLLQLLGPAVEVPVYQDTPLAISDVCAMSSLNRTCPGRTACTFSTLKLANARKEENLIAVNNRCQTIVLNAAPLNLSGHIRQLTAMGASTLRADFCWMNYAPTVVLDIWNRLRHDMRDHDAWTANLFR